MRRALGINLSILLGALACEGREVLVFDLPGGSSASAGVATLAGSSGSAGASAGAALGGSSSNVAGSESGSGGSNGGAGGDIAGGEGGSVVGTAGGGGAAPRPCIGKGDCGPGWACQRGGCDTPLGECVPFDHFCSPDPVPVCGCNGVTYWNDCLRINAGAQLAGPGPCKANACSCEVSSDCGVPYASCSHLLPPGETCGHGIGTCWMVPFGCPPNADKKLWRECKPPDQGPPGPCVDTCNAIASGRTYAELRRGDTCN